MDSVKQLTGDYIVLRVIRNNNFAEDVVPSNLLRKYRLSGGACCLHLQGREEK
jgi:hypothetical protein